MATNILYTGDENPSITATLLDGSGNAINLTGFTVKFGLRRYYATSNLMKNAATVVSTSAGTVRYTPSNTDFTNAPVGIYWGQWELTDGSGNIQHISAGDFEMRKAA